MCERTNFMNRNPFIRAAGLLVFLITFGSSHLAFAQWTEQSPILQASDEVDSARFGTSVAMDGNVTVVGAYQHPSGGSFRGQAYIIRFNGTSWAQEQILQASDEVDFAYFGSSVAVSGNVAVVGAYRHSSGGSLRGQAYVFRYNGSIWVEEQILQASDEANNAWFGISVTLDSNVAVVGAYRHPSGGTNRGQAYVFRHDGSNWIEEQILQASDEANGASFGYSVATKGTVAVVSAYAHPSGGSSRGQTYMFRHNGSVWVEEQILQASDEADFAVFGSSVAVDANVALVGAYQRNRVYVYRHNGASWAEEQILQASDEAGPSLFGTSVALSGPVAVVGAWLHPSGGSNRGQAYVFRYNGATWPQEQILQASDEADDAEFGGSVDVDGIMAVVGAYYHPSGGTQRGQAYTFGPTPNAAGMWKIYQ